MTTKKGLKYTTCAHCREPLRAGERFRVIKAPVRPMLACPRCRDRIDGNQERRADTC